MNLSNYPPKSPISAVNFTFDLAIHWDDVSRYNTIDGFLIHLVDPYSIFGRPIAVPAGMHAYIEMSQPVHRIDKTLCFDTQMPDTIFGPYDPDGHLCKLSRDLNEFTLKYAGCQMAEGLFVPNESVVCTGNSALPIKSSVAYSDKLDIDKVEKAHVRPTLPLQGTNMQGYLIPF